MWAASLCSSHINTHTPHLDRAPDPAWLFLFNVGSFTLLLTHTHTPHLDRAPDPAWLFLLNVGSFTLLLDPASLPARLGRPCEPASLPFKREA
eukprot:1158294-Pelagomonas_calceolata.AAC.1